MFLLKKDVYYVHLLTVRIWQIHKRSRRWQRDVYVYLKSIPRIKPSSNGPSGGGRYAWALALLVSTSWASQSLEPWGRVTKIPTFFLSGVQIYYLCDQCGNLLARQLHHITMRCKNCGWPNQPGETHCVKCHAPLEMGNDGTVVENYPQPRGAEPNLKKTVLDASPLMGAAAPSPAMEMPQGNSCPQCGFPLRPGSDHCPKCGAPVGAPAPTPERGTVINPSVEESKPVTSGAKFKNFKPGSGTVNPYLDGFEAELTAFLQPVKRSSEKKALENIEVEGEEFMLKRDNTDPGNVTIATGTQAVITREGDKWFITDKSDTHTTFVLASDKTPLEDGSLILLGNRLFEFHIQ